jgi:hypothetical protein
MLRSAKVGVAACVLASLLASGAAAAMDCKQPRTGTDKAPLFSPPLSAVVVGAGRLQFYSAPGRGCAMNGVFVVPKDSLIVYAQSADGWSSVMYLNPKTGESVSGWVRSDRLKATGTLGPRAASRNPVSL